MERFVMGPIIKRASFVDLLLMAKTNKNKQTNKQTKRLKINKQTKIIFKKTNKK